MPGVRGRTTLTGMPRNPRTGLVDMSPADVREAEHYAREQVIFNMRFLRCDLALAGSPADEAMAERFVAAAKDNPTEALRMMRVRPTAPFVATLFSRRCLFFSPQEPAHV